MYSLCLGHLNFVLRLWSSEPHFGQALLRITVTLDFVRLAPGRFAYFLLLLGFLGFFSAGYFSTGYFFPATSVFIAAIVSARSSEIQQRRTLSDSAVFAGESNRFSAQIGRGLLNNNIFSVFQVKVKHRSSMEREGSSKAKKGALERGDRAHMSTTKKRCSINYYSSQDTIFTIQSARKLCNNNINQSVRYLCNNISLNNYY